MKRLLPVGSFLLFGCVLLVACGNRAAPADGSVPDSSVPDAGVAQSCEVSACAGGMAVTCDQQLRLDCTPFQGSCATFTDGTTTYPWCNCGTIGEGQGICLGGANAVVCQSGMAVPGSCPQGTLCVVDATQPNGLGCQCDNVADGVCPDASCTTDPDCQSCTPNCAGRACGGNGCGGTCGSCPPSQTCDSSGQCQACMPSCSGRACGPDGCGGSCGTCASGSSCNTTTGACETTCVPACTGRTCGGDGCGGSCGMCPADQECKDDGSGCKCGFFSTVTFTVGLEPDVNWFADTDIGAVNEVEVQLTPLDLDGMTPTQKPGDPIAFGYGVTASQMQTLYGCTNKVRVLRTYRFNAGPGRSDLICTATDDVTGTTITIPYAGPQMISPDGGTCTLPPL